MYSLVGVDGNAFAIMGYVKKAMKREGFKDYVNEYMNQAMSSDYNNLLVVSMDWIDKINDKIATESSDDDEESIG